MGLERRVFLGLTLAGAGSWGLDQWLVGPPEEAASRLPAKVRISRFDATGRLTGTVELPTIRKTDAQWKASLPVDQYMVTRRGDTELAFAGEYWNFHGDGLYLCVCCGTALFDSKLKFNSGTGWPSFTQPIATANVLESPDHSFGTNRTEVSCRLCGGHLGHLFDDGPPPEHNRFCMNSVALRFVPRENNLT
ncbi:MAG: peptide-methionine (R)-S-oxide reductase [Bryobacterales bacterium]|jgi:peptide-methionine (R)-S-oxide reductase|nr:peptide-methionine (R)-S-oxide reductase [Bryobacterales bacterium]